MAGKGAPRKLVDFGYCILPDGRDAQTKVNLATIEVKPQAFDWLFAWRRGIPAQRRLRQSGRRCEPDRVAFQRRVHAQVMAYLGRAF
ncbi:elongation factor P hydroxylase [Salmonella enterica subsp. enterica]|nr:elongation factor P hydroxylase [Salmonella enterica subsp. enterica]